MDLWHILYILGGTFLGWTIPWKILQFSDAGYILDQIFRILYWGTVLISLELTDGHWIFSLLFGLIPGAIIWGFYDHWFDNGDEYQTLGDDFEYGISIGDLQKSESVIILQTPAVFVSTNGVEV